jgi:glycine cleavage system H protein
MTVKFTSDHEWVRLEGDTAIVGITSYAAGQLGDVVYVELPVLGTVYSKGHEIAVVESAKAASDVYAPVAGEVIAVNDDLTGNPQLVNESPEGEGWFLKLKIKDAGEFEALMDAEAYQAALKAL